MTTGRREGTECQHVKAIRERHLDAQEVLDRSREVIWAVLSERVE